MRSYSTDRFTFNYNSDLSRDITIRDHDNSAEVEVPSDVLMNFFGYVTREQLQGICEDMIDNMSDMDAIRMYSSFKTLGTTPINITGGKNV